MNKKNWFIILVVICIFLGIAYVITNRNDNTTVIKSTKLSLTDNVTVNELEAHDSYYPGGLFAQIYMDKKDIKEDDLIDFAYNQYSNSEYYSYAIRTSKNKGIVFLDGIAGIAYYAKIDEYGRLKEKEGFLIINKDNVEYFTVEEMKNRD